MGRRGTIDTSKHEQWRQRLQQWQGSGLSVRAFCRQHDLSEPAFHWWRRRLLGAKPTTVAPPAATFVPLTIAASAPPALSLHLPNGLRLRIPAGCDRQGLADVLALLGVSPC